jgi:hypothetical protein
MIYDYLSVHFFENGINVTNFMVSTSFPKADLEDMTATIQDLVSFVSINIKVMITVSELLFCFWVRV